MGYEIYDLSEKTEYMEEASRWFSRCWGIPAEVYKESMQAAADTGCAVPHWYIAVSGGDIIGGTGVIDNDFHDRKDLAPNICAVYVESGHRCKGIAGRLLDTAAGRLFDSGYDSVYLLTDLDGFYERYGWEHHCSAQSDDGEQLKVYRLTRGRKI